jgi:L-amino acid N-acyltransferase YncA
MTHSTPIHYKTVFGSPVMHVMPYAWIDLIENGWIDEFCRPFEYDEEAFAIVDNTIPLTLPHTLTKHDALKDRDKVLGFITFKDYNTVDYSNVIEVGIGYVIPSQRKKGLYDHLYKRLRYEAVKRKKTFIWSSVWATNKDMLKHAERTGRKIRYIGIEERL